MGVLTAVTVGGAGLSDFSSQKALMAESATGSEAISGTTSMSDSIPDSLASRQEPHTSDPFGHWALKGKESFTLAEMLTYAIQDEYGAYAEYEWIIETYGPVKPYTNILQAEQTHIDLLLPLLEKYGVPIPNRAEASAHITNPASLLEAARAGVQAEIDNIAMYDTFLSQNDLPADVRNAFEKLRTASTHHLRAFQNQMDK
ncbi:DUF2202 domain-containing protein [Hydrogenibacillus sp. N12]|uniref:ferritin-like domain-containing protein n=1 Tax=Hydrogenibacillus sp. N12 TaxID=2866627 RepID=UPI001C7CD151|nr:DUF2202 domain-containing protein [Hydrogenibacillus sp. N12]QZA32447.1 DUF2202 domain-containing protein [Hydrogenibacillus sp. N12]